MKATILNCTLKKSPEESNTEALITPVRDDLRSRGVEVTTHRLVDLTLAHGVVTDAGDGDEWPTVHADIVASDILIIATPTWVGHPSSVAQQALERINAMMSETGEDDQPITFGKVAGVIVTGNEDGAHHVIAEIAQGLIDTGFTIPGQAWTYWNRGPGPGPTYTETDEGRDWSIETGRTMVRNLITVAQCLGW